MGTRRRAKHAALRQPHWRLRYWLSCLLVSGNRIPSPALRPRWRKCWSPRNIAGLTIADLGPGQSQMAIRGISAGQVIRDQPGVKEQVGVYLDESPISVALFTPDLELFDLDRFEVLRGPQGTLFGAGSEAGTVRYITRQPQLEMFEGVADASFEDVKHGDEGGSARGAVNLPIANRRSPSAIGSNLPSNARGSTTTLHSLI